MFDSSTIDIAINDIESINMDTIDIDLHVQ